MVALWNTTTTPPIARCRELTPERRKRAALRLKERPLAEWCTVFERIERSPFCRGVNDRGWVASFDWIVRGPESAVRVLEGKYDGRQGVETTAAREAPPIWQTVLDRLQSRLCQRDLITWFRPLVCVRDDGDQIVLRAGETVVAYLRKHFTSAFTDALHEARPDLRVEWQVTEEVA